MDIVTLPQKPKSEVKEEQKLSKQPETSGGQTKGKKVDEDSEQDSIQPSAAAAATVQADQSVTAIVSATTSLQSVESHKDKEKVTDVTSSDETTVGPGLEIIGDVKEQQDEVMGEEKEGSVEIEQEVISQDGALGHMDEFIVMDSGGGQYVRPPKRVSLAEYIKRRKVTDSSSFESSQPTSERESMLLAKLSAARSERAAALEGTSAQAEGEGGSQRRSPTTEAISEALKAEIVGMKGQIQLEKRTKDVEKDSAVKSKEATSSTSEKGPASRQLSPILPPLAIKKIDVHAASEQSKSDSTQTSKIPVSSRVTSQQPHRFSSPISTPLPSHPTFPSMLQQHPAAAPSHSALPQPAAPSAAAAASWNYGSYSHLFYQQPGIGPSLAQQQDHWPFGHQFYPSGATAPQSASPLDFQNSLRSLGFDDVPPPPPPVLVSPDHLLTGLRSHSISRSRSRSRTRSQTRSRSRTRSRTRSRSVSRSPRSVTRSRSRSRSPLMRPRSRSPLVRPRSRSPLVRPRSRRSRSRSRSRNKSPRRSRGRGVSRSRTPSTPDHERITNVMMQLSEHLSAHLLQTMQVQEDMQKVDFGVQVSPSTSSMGAQIGSGFKLRSISSQTCRPARRVTRGVQCSTHKHGMGIQTDSPNFQSAHTQTHIKKRTVGCQMGSSDVGGASSSNVFEALLQESDQDFSEFTEILEDAKKKFAEAIGLTLDELSDDECLFDVSISPENTSSVDVQGEGDQKEEEKDREDEEEGDKDPQPMAPSPVISGASNISDGEWSDLEGSSHSNSNSRKPSESATPTRRVEDDHSASAVPAQLQEVADALQSCPTTSKDVKDMTEVEKEPSAAKPKSSSTPAPIPPPLKLTTPPLPDISAFSSDCESQPFCSPVSMVISPIADSDIDEILIEEQKKAELEASKDPAEKSEGCSTTGKSPIPAVESGKQSKGQSTDSESASLKGTTDNSSVKESKQKRSSTTMDMFGPSLPPDLPQTTTVYGPALPPSNSEPEPQNQSEVHVASAEAADTPAPAYGPPLPPPRTSYDVPLPPTYGPTLPPASSDITEEEQADNDCVGASAESKGHRESVKDKEGEEVTTDSQGAWQIRSISLPPFKMSGGSTPSSNSNSNSGRSTPLISNKSTPFSSPGDDGSKNSEQSAKHHPKSVSPQSLTKTVPSDSSEKSKLDPGASVKHVSDGSKRQLSSGRDSDEQTFKSPRKRKRSRRHDSSDERRSKELESPKEKRTKKGSSSDDSSDGGSSGSSTTAFDPKPKSRPDTLTTKKLQEAFESSSSLIENVRKAASSSPPSSNSKKFGSDPILFPVKKKPILTAQELLEKVRAKKLHVKSPEETFKPQLGRESQQGSPASTPLSPGCLIGQGSILLSPPPGRHDSAINMQELMMKFHQHMAAKKNVSQDSSWVHHTMPVPPPTISPFVRPPPPPHSPSHIPLPLLVQPLPPLPPRLPTAIGMGMAVMPPSNVGSMSSGDKTALQSTHEASKPAEASSAIDTAASDSEDDIDAQLEAIMDANITQVSDGNSDDDIDAQLEAVMDSHITQMRSKSHLPSKFSQQSSSSTATKELVSLRALSIPPKALNPEQPVSKEKDSSSSSQLSLPSSTGKPSAAPTSSEHFLAAELVQHSSSEESGTVGPAATSKATVDRHFPTNKHSSATEKAKHTSDKEKDHKKSAKCEDCTNPSVTSDQPKEPLASPSIEQYARATPVSKLDLLPSSQAVESASKPGVKSSVASTPDRPVSIMYQSSVLDPVSPTGLFDDPPLESSIGQTIAENENSPMSEHEYSIALLETTKVSGVAPQEGSTCSGSSEMEKEVEDRKRDKARCDVECMSTKEVISSHSPDPKLPTPESGDAVSDQGGHSKDMSSELVRPTALQDHNVDKVELASCDAASPDTKDQAYPTDTVEKVVNDGTQVDTVDSSQDKGGEEDEKGKEQPMVVEVESGTPLPKDDSCLSGQPGNLLTEQFPAEQDLLLESSSNQPLTSEAGNDTSKELCDAQVPAAHDNVAMVTNISEPSQVTTNTEVHVEGTDTDAVHLESDQAPLSNELGVSVPKRMVHQLSPPPPVAEQHQQEQEMIAQAEEISRVSQKQEKDVHEVKSQPVHVYEKDVEEKEADESKGADSAPLQEASSVDLYPAPAQEDLGGRGSRDSSPETFRGEGIEDAPELTDVSGEDFVVSRSPSFSPTKLPFSSPLHFKITAAAVGEGISRHTCVLPLIDNETSNFELNDGIKEGESTDVDDITYVKDNLMEEKSSNDTLQRTFSATSSDWDPFADSSESSPLQSPGVSSESPKRQLPPPVTDKVAPDATKGTVSSSVESVFGGSTDSSYPPLQSPDLSSSSERQEVPPTVEPTSGPVDSVESSVTRGTLTAVIDETISQTEQPSIPGEMMDTRSVSKDHESMEETKVKGAEAETDTKIDGYHNDEILVGHTPAPTCTPVGEPESTDTFTVTESDPASLVMEPAAGQTGTTTLSGRKKAVEVQVAIQEGENVDYEDAGEQQDTNVAALPSAQLSSLDTVSSCLFSTAANTMVTCTETTPTKLIGMNVPPEFVKPRAPSSHQSSPTSGIVESSTTEATSTTVSLAPPTTRNEPTSLCLVSQAPPTGSMQATPIISSTTVSSSSDSVITISTPDVPSTSTVTSSAKSTISSLPTALTTPTSTPSTVVTLSPLIYKAPVKSRKPKTRIVPPRSCNANKTSPDDNRPALISSTPVSLAVSAPAVSSSPSVTSPPVTCLPSQVHHSRTPAVVTAETLMSLIQMLCKSSPDQRVYLSFPTAQQQPSSPSSSATTTTTSGGGGGVCKGAGKEPLVAASPSSLKDLATAIVTEDNKELCGQKGSESWMCASDKDEGLPETTTAASEVSVSESGQSCMEEEATVDSTSDHSAHCETGSSEEVTVDSQPCGQGFEQNADLANIEARSVSEMELSEEVNSTGPSSSAPPSCPEEKSDTSVKVCGDESEHTDPCKVTEKIKNNDVPTQPDHSESPDVAEGSVQTQTPLDHSEPPYKVQSCSMQTRLDHCQLPGEVESSVTETTDIQLPTSEPIQTNEDQPLSPLPPTITMASVTTAPSKEQPLPAESPTAGGGTSTTETGEEREKESETVEAATIPVLPVEQEEGKSRESDDGRESAPAVPEMGSELLSNVNCCSNSERASPILDSIVQEQETASPCSSTTTTGSLADELNTQNQSQGVVSSESPSLVIKVPATFVESTQPALTNSENQAEGTSLLPSNGVPSSGQSGGEGVTPCDDDHGSLNGQLSEVSSRCSSRSPSEEKKRSRIGSRSPLFISLPAHYLPLEKRVIKGPSERFRSHTKGKGKGHKRLVVSLPITLYWRTCQELDSRKVLKSEAESLPPLVTPITPMVSKKHLKKDVCSLRAPEQMLGTENADSAKEKESLLSPSVPLVVSYPLTLLVVSSIGSKTDTTIHHSPSTFPVDKKSSALANESSGQILNSNGHDGNQEDTQLALRSYPALPASPVKSIFNHFSSPERLSTRRMQIGGNPLEREGSKNSLDFVLEELSSGEKKIPAAAATTGAVEVSNYSPTLATCVDFLSPDDYTCEDGMASSPHVVVIGSPQDSEGSDLRVATVMAAGEVLSVHDHSSGRDGDKQGTCTYTCTLHDVWCSTMFIIQHIFAWFSIKDCQCRCVAACVVKPLYILPESLAASKCMAYCALFYTHACLP